MNEIEFRKWMSDNDIDRKVISDTVSRLRRIEKEIDQCDIDDEYDTDRCKNLLEKFLIRGKQDLSQNKDGMFAAEKYYRGTYRLALKKYIMFRDAAKNKLH